MAAEERARPGENPAAAPPHQAAAPGHAPGFFRDSQAFAALAAEVIAPLLARTAPDGAIRAWVAGCGTGAEAYALAIFLREQLAAAGKFCRLQIFATERDRGTLAAARQGHYPASIAADLTPERLARCFDRLPDGSYQVNEPLRELITFAAHNLTTDAPLGRMDLISCRHALTELAPAVRDHVVALLHFALNEGGCLFLGPTESAPPADLFAPLSAPWGIFWRRGPTWLGLEFPGAKGKHPADAPGRAGFYAELTGRLTLDLLGAAAVLVNPKREILYFLGPAGRYLEIPQGVATRDLLKMARAGLRPRLRSAIYQALREHGPVVLRAVSVQRDGTFRSVAVTVKPVPVPDAREPLLLVTFQDEPEATAAPPTAGPAETRTGQLEQQLHDTRRDLQTNLEDLEESYAQLEGSHSAVRSMNEQLQAANEELQTAAEELRAFNEELRAVNAQLQEKVHELETTNTDLANLLDCTDVATVFLDRTLRIKRFTPAAGQLFHFLAADLGRPLSDLAARFTDPDLLDDARQVLGGSVSTEKEIVAAPGGRWLRRVMPYRAPDGSTDGVTLTFVDITERQRAADRALREREQRLQAVLDTAVDAIITIDEQGRMRSANAATERMFGYRANELLGANVNLLMPAPFHDEHDGYLERYCRTGERHIIGIGREVQGRRKDGSLFPVDLAVSEVGDGAGRNFTGMLRDLSARKALEREVLDTAALEQQRIGRELHDNTAQELTALGLVADSLRAVLPDPTAPEARLAERLVQGLNHVLGQVRAIARGLIRVEVHAEELMAALAELAAQTTELNGVQCTFNCSTPIHLTDSHLATQLYYIAREAVTNALKHAQCRSIIIHLTGADGTLTLRVQDDGIGLPEPPLDARGMGLKSMRYRAGLINAHLSVAPAEPAGTTVTCRCQRALPKEPRTQ